jgi:pilus assembly protein CpaB
MRPITIVLIVIAVISAGSAVLVAKRTIEHRAADAAARQKALSKEVEVLVAALELPQGHIMRDTDLRWDRWPSGAADPNRFIIRVEDEPAMGRLPGSATRRPITAGEPITAAALFAPGGTKGMMPGMLMPGKKAVGITVSAASTASGFVLPGDFVDVILTVDLQKAEVSLPGGGRYAAETILRSVRVLAVDQAINSGNATAGAKRSVKNVSAGKDDQQNQPEEVAMVGKTVAIEATPEEAERVLAAQATGSLSLVLRSLAVSDTPDPVTGEYTRDVDTSRVLRLATGGGVKVIKGGQIVH